METERDRKKKEKRNKNFILLPDVILLPGNIKYYSHVYVLYIASFIAHMIIT